MSVSLEEIGLPPRPNITIYTVDRETVRAIIRAEHTLIDQAIRMGIDADEAHCGYAPYIEKIMSSLSDGDRAEFERLFVEESLDTDNLVAVTTTAEVSAPAVEPPYADAAEQPKPLSTATIFFAGVNVTILIGLAVFWALR
jgi:hypothetical protein